MYAAAAIDFDGNLLHTSKNGHLDLHVTNNLINITSDRWDCLAFSLSCGCYSNKNMINFAFSGHL